MSIIASSLRASSPAVAGGKRALADQDRPHDANDAKYAKYKV
jgi:hypothetical protein